MLQTKFQRLILSFPLHSQIAVAIALILGLLGIFIPLVYLYLAVQDPGNVTKYLVVSRNDLFQVIDIFSCSSYIKGVELPPYRLTDNSWNIPIRMVPLMIVMDYFKKYTSKKSQNLMLALILLGIVLIVSLDVLFTPARITCQDGWQVTIYAYSVSWLSVLIPVFSLLFGMYAIQKRKMVAMMKTHSLDLF